MNSVRKLAEEYVKDKPIRKADVGMVRHIRTMSGCSLQAAVVESKRAYLIREFEDTEGVDELKNVIRKMLPLIL